MKKPEFANKLPKLNFAKVGIAVLVVLCLAVLVYDLSSGTEGEALLAEAPLNDPETPQDVPDPEQQPSTTDQPQAEDTFYSEYRLQREQVRAEELELLQGIIDDTNSSQEMRDLANSRKIEIAAAMEYELMTENVLYAKEFGETVVMLGSETATVILSGTLDDIVAAQVADAVTSVTGVSFENVVIINR